MKRPPVPLDEAARLEALRLLDVLDTPEEEGFDRLTRLAARLFSVPIALVSLVDVERQWFKSHHGLPVRETPRDVSFCGHALTQPAPLVIPDAHADERFADNPLVTGAPHVRFYAGAPLRTAEGHALGTLCLIDQEARTFTDEQRATLVDLAALVVEQLELRRARRVAAQESDQLHGLLAALPTPVSVHRDGVVLFANHAAETVLGVESGQLVGRREDEFAVPGTLTPESSQTRLERKVRRSDGTERIVASLAIPIRWRGRAAAVVAHRDVSGERELEQRRARAAAFVARQLGDVLTVFDSLGEGIVLFDDLFRCVYANRAMGELFGLPSEDLLGWTPDDAVRHLATMSATPEQMLQSAAVMRQPVDGEHRPALTVTLTKPKHRVVRRELHRLALPDRPWAAVWTDVTREATQLARSEAAATTDALTKIPNRRAAETELSHARATSGPVSVVMFDVDHFKKVNDTFGHDVGDEVLVAVAGALRSSARAGDFVARWGGEEFIAVLRADGAAALRFAERVRLAVAALTTRAGAVTISGGIGGELKAADEKLYEAKRAGRNRVLT